MDRLERDVTEHRIAALLARLGAASIQPRELPADTPLAAVLATVAAQPS